MTLSKEKEEALRQRMEKLALFESDLIEKFILGSGPGGQKINKSSSCVYLKHLPTGIEIKCQQERSLPLNRYRARVILCEKREKELFNIESAKEKEAAKIRKQKKRRSRKVKEKMIAEKRELSAKKAGRKPPQENSLS